MNRALAVLAAPTLLALAACGGSTDVDTTDSPDSAAGAYESTTDACLDYGEAIQDFPTEAPAFTSAGLSAWADTVLEVAGKVQTVAERTEDTDAMVAKLMKEVSDTMRKAAEATQTMADDPSDENVMVANELVQDGTLAIKNVTTSCFGDS